MYMTKSLLKPEKKRKYENQIIFYINLYVKDGLGIEFAVC